MKRIQEKVKDIVEVRPFRSIRDFTADPAETLNNYYFTDATADLMAKWLDGIASVQSRRGVAYALAGYRGVGKSHFLATLGGLAASPDLRGRVSESHVEFSAQRLQRRHYPVSHLRRGTHGTLLEELKAAVGKTFQLDSLDPLDSFESVIGAALERSGDTPWILLIDTALERGSRVTRDDGPNLSLIAEAARSNNIFVGVALDDDIAGADGSNAAIVRSYAIDYLDQAHLYKVVNAHVFPKDSQKQAILHDIYGYFREVLPSFRWSEQKFSALYPLHPAILEVAPYVRLYVHDFALLGFASEAGEKILGRPANSLIALDEVYDNAENGLRKIDDLQEAFAAYDAINTTVVNKIPVMQRLQAKLILKALLLLSLDGQGGTASDICASELIFDESDPDRAIATVDELLRTFAEALPNDFRVVAEDGLEPRYSFKVSSKENLNNALTEAVMQVSADTVPNVLRRVFQERFPEAAPAGEGSEQKEGVIELELTWRGARRKGAIVWPGSSIDGLGPWADWQVAIQFDGAAAADGAGQGDIARVIWKPDPLRPDEVDKLRSYHVLVSNADLREKYSEQIRASVHAHSMAAEKILTRSFLEDGQITIDGFDYNFTEEARAAQALSDVFASMLEPLFETRYPSHPYFTREIETDDVASIVTDVYNGTRRVLADVQSRAQTFAFPLGLVQLEGTSFVPESHERLGALAISREVLSLVEASGDAPVGLSDIYSALKQPPYGLGLAAQQMLITALVAERYIEFVTATGNRINRRSLDLKIIWEDIVGVAKPVETSASGESLKRWAKLFVKDAPFESLNRPSDREELTNAFAAWAAEWESARILERFQELPEDILNVQTWRLASRITRSFGAVAETIRKAAAGTAPLEDCLERVAEAFGGSESDFVEVERQIDTLTSFVRTAGLREEARIYVAASEATEVEEIESLRERLLSLIDAANADPNENINRELGYAWDKFRRAYAEHFQARHNKIMNSPERKAKLNETLKSEEWAEFDILSKLPGFDQRFAAASALFRVEIAGLDCTVDPLPLLERQPYCNCRFSLNGTSQAELLPAAFNDNLRAGLASFRRILGKNGEDLARSIERLAEKKNDADLEAACHEVAASLRSGREIPRFNDLQLKILVEVLTDNASEERPPARSEPSSTLKITDPSQSFREVITPEHTDDPILLNV
ncbi:MAG: hypothetical protein IT174_01890 [Acidobacteria bacterium]|nr:hypothetical protein [Acidobacteriota bacterium]